VSAAFDVVPGGILTLSSDLRILAANRGLGRLVGCEPAELVGRTFDVLLSGASRILFQTHVYPALTADGRVEEVFLTLADAAGEPVPALLNAVRVEPGSGSSPDAAYEALIVRIRARSKWETDLLEATRTIEAERRASERLAADLASAAEDLARRHEEERRTQAFRDAFIGIVSHELRTPITTIYGMSHVLRRRHASMPTEAVGQHLVDIEDESDRLRRLTEDLLVLSRAQGGRLELATDPIVLGHLVRSVVQAEQGRAPEHEIAVDAAPGLPLVLGEEIYIEQVVRNFLSNAAKYSPPGTRVSVVVAIEGEGVAVRVTDDGPGLPPDSPDRLFDLFYRAPETLRQTSGAGIGLFVCRELISAMQGRVWAAPADAGSGLGGAEFGFWLPMANEDVGATG
jgi:signal transduction histidine kinase